MTTAPRRPDEETCEYLQTRIKVLEDRISAHFGIMAIFGAAIAASSENTLLAMLEVYRDRYAERPASTSDVIMANEVDAIISVLSPRQSTSLRVIQGGLPDSA